MTRGRSTSAKEGRVHQHHAPAKYFVCVPSSAKKAASRRRASSGEIRRTHDEVDPSTKFRVVQTEPVLKPILAERAAKVMANLVAARATAM